MMDELALREAIKAQEQGDDQGYDGEKYEFVEQMIKTDSNLPLFFNYYFYTYIGKDSVLSKLDSTEIEKILLCFQNEVHIFTMGMPTYEFTSEVHLFLHQFKNLLRLRLHRSEGGFERKEISGTTQERRLILNDDAGAPQMQGKRSFWRK